MKKPDTLPKRPLGKTGAEVTILGLGGEGILRTFGQEEEAVPLIHRALDLGITYFETARAYSGSESYYGMALGERRKEIFLASKSHERTMGGAQKQLETTLGNLRTHYLDLWMVHDIRTPKDLEQIFGPREPLRPSKQPARMARSDSQGSPAIETRPSFQGLSTCFPLMSYSCRSIRLNPSIGPSLRMPCPRPPKKDWGSWG